MAKQHPPNPSGVPASLRSIIARVPCWANARSVQVLPLQDAQSLNNTAYRVSSDGTDYVLRVATDTAHFLAIDRRHERAAAVAAADAGIGPPVHYADDDGTLVTTFVHGRHWTPDAFHDPANMARVARMLRQLHAISAVPADGSVFRRIERLLTNAATLGLSLPAAAPDGLARLGAIEAARAADGRFGPGLSHNDFWSNNFLDDGERLWLVDWEFAGDGDGLFDLATLSLGAGYSEAEQRTLLELYGATADDGLGQVRAMMIVVYCFEGAWALVQHGLRGSTGYDYAAHAERMFRRAAEADGA